MIANPDNRVEYDLWYSSILDMSYEQLNDIGLYQETLNNHTLFTPRIFTYSCTSCKDEVKKKNCVSDGEYCLYMPKHALPNDLATVDPVAMLEQSLREKCIYKELLKEERVNYNFTKWFNYAINVVEDCKTAHSFLGECSHRQMRHLKIDEEAVKNCVDNSFVRKGDR
jgi:hypothetical protein